ncbi:MAG: type 1 glutamine amidotransferase [Candidatus Omnitrophica bacterium]|nr:type 1 glutamine amidotransferase [Candidatus Omnitrophota bacterium]
MPKEILFIKHIDIEGPGSIEEFFSATGRPLKTVDLSCAGHLPDDLSGIAAVISLGGPMNVYEEGKYPFLKEEDGFLKMALRQGIPILGICLGAQLLAKACGAKVKKATVEEIGWRSVSLTRSGRGDPLFKGLDSRLDVLQWHQDTFEIPEGGIRLAESGDCLNQAFKIGRNAYGIQFHIEVTARMIESWLARYSPEGCLELKPEEMLKETRKRKEVFKEQTEIVCSNLDRIIAGSDRTGVA